MKCPLNKIWPLFYYKDLKSENLINLSQHLKVCPKCRTHYEALSDTLSGISKTQVDLSEPELSKMIQSISGEPNSSFGIFEQLKVKSSEFVEKLHWGIFYQPQFAWVMVAVLLITLFVPLQRKQAIFQEQLFDLQMDLVSGEDDFETFLDLYSLEEQSQNPSSTIIVS
ncbi:MAG: hypothetical protein K9L86_03175 [Candidatus Omnitrophica bacterium]|nr:hypothetical protein [Candidatus Omnitrophota bacterium]